MKGENKNFDAVNAYLKQWQEMAKRIREQFAPVIKQQKTFSKSIQPIIEAQNTFKKSLDPIIAGQERLKRLLQSIAPALEQLQKSFQDLPPQTQEALLLLGNHGWYFDLKMSLSGLLKFKIALSEGSLKEVEEALIEHFEGRVDDIENSIIKKFPKRGKVIGAAFNAHQREEYELSIPVFLAQTDGICKEVTGQYLFMKRNNKPGTANYVKQVALVDTFKGALLNPLSQTLPIGASKHQRAEDFNELNRHMVLHGESLDYGTKTNSLKAISLINYVVQVLTLDEENP